MRAFPYRVQNLTTHYRFRFTDGFAFTEPGLDPQKIVPFINDFGINVLITGHKATAALPTILSSTIGRHTGIVHLQPTNTGVAIQRFEWIHHIHRPNGSRLPVQCHQCLSYRSWIVPPNRPKKYNKKLVFACGKKGCTAVCKIHRLKGYKQFPAGLTAGEWYSKTL